MVEDIKKEDIPSIEEYEDYIRKDSRLMFNFHTIASLGVIEGILVAKGLATKDELNKLIDNATNDMIHKNAQEAREAMIKLVELSNSEPDAKDGE